MADPNFLSDEPIRPQDRLIVPLDVPTHEEALGWVDRLGDAVHFYKVGLELGMAGDHRRLVEELVRRGKQVFVDFKFFDIPATVASAVRSLAGSGASFATVHGDRAMIEAAAREKGDVKILAVTVLTSLDEGDLREMGFAGTVEALVLARARGALDAGADGVISSGREARALREKLGKKFLVVSPGIRPAEDRPADDQKRVVTVEQAFRAGADYIVVGRPIRNAADPAAAAAGIQQEIAALFG